jgi:hypothetical protein
MKTEATCGYCLRTLAVDSKGYPVRHGFAAHNVRHGFSGGWHTGPCHGTDFPHHGISPDACQASHRRAENSIARLFLEQMHLAARPALTYTIEPSRFDARHGAKPASIEIVDGAGRSYFAPEHCVSGYPVPSYDELHRSRTAKLQLELENAVAWRDTCNAALADWAPKSATPRKRKAAP